MTNPEVNVCLWIDDPQLRTQTKFFYVRAEDPQPEHTRPNGFNPDTVLYAADIYIPPDAGRGVITSIDAQWQAGDDALYLQHLGAGRKIKALILGYTLVYDGNEKGNKFSLIRIYTLGNP